MDQVYRATDTQLGRDVALKILPNAFAADPDRLARFQREAQVLDSLNHPGIAAIYGIEKTDDTQTLVLELVERPTLADRIATVPIPLDEALSIAEALGAAHEVGVIHRDLKPANIKVREDRTVKVLDFGLAKALDTTREGNPSQLPTLTAAATQMGVIMGTAAYMMSPEQARGKPVDTRADIWAFGAVVSEMLTGRRAFEGEDFSVTLADVIRANTSWERLPAGVPPTLRTYLRRCLHKKPSQRIRDIGDVRLAMAGAFETTTAAVAPLTATPPIQVWQQPIPLVLGGLALVGLGGLAVWNTVRPEPGGAEDLVRLTMNVPDRMPPGSISQGLAISRDGSYVVYMALDDGGAAPQLKLRRSPPRSARAAWGRSTSPVTQSSTGTWRSRSCQRRSRPTPIADEE